MADVIFTSFFFGHFKLFLICIIHVLLFKLDVFTSHFVHDCSTVPTLMCLY